MDELLIEAVNKCYKNNDFIKQYNRVTSSKIKNTKQPIDILIDDATGVTDIELLKFILFVHKYVVTPIV